MNEFIAFRTAPTITALLQELSLLDGQCVLHPPALADWPETLHGIVNGRHALPGLLCFVDRDPDDEARQALQGAVVITTDTLAPALTDAFVIATRDPRALFIDYVNRQIEGRTLENLSSLAATPCNIADSAQIHPRAIVEEGVSIGEHVIIAAGAVIKRGSVIGPHCVIRENTVIGCVGIALYRSQDGRLLRFPHIAGVHIGRNTEIGTAAVIPRGALSSTRIGRDGVIGNLCNIGHGTCIGDQVWMSVGSLVGGNCRIGHRTTIGMGATIRDNIVIGDEASIGMGSVVTKSVEPGASLFGNPARRLPSIVAGPDR